MVETTQEIFVAAIHKAHEMDVPWNCCVSTPWMGSTSIGRNNEQSH